MDVRQVVRVVILGAAREYTYQWVYTPPEGGPLSAGDKVEIPSNEVSPEGSSATVVAFGSTYDGPMKSIVRVIKQAGDNMSDSRVEDDLWLGFGEGRYA